MSNGLVSPVHRTRASIVTYYLMNRQRDDD